MDDIGLLKNLGTVLIIAGLLLTVCAGHLFHKHKLYAYIQLKRGKQEQPVKSTLRAAKKKKKERMSGKKKDVPINPEEKEESITVQEETSAHKKDAGGASTTAPLDAPASEGTVLLENSVREASVQTDADAVWMEPSEGFYIKKSIMFIHTEESISEKGEVL